MTVRAGRRSFPVHGAGETLVLVPGISGRWEWMRPAFSALGRRFRVISFSLAGEPGSGRPLRTFESHLEQVDEALAHAGCGQAIVCGVSFGGLVALRYAATEPGRVSRLVLVSTPAPSWRPDARIRRDAASPLLAVPGFLAGAVRRAAPELRAAIPEQRRRYATVAASLGTIVRHPGSPWRMAARLQTLAGRDFAADARAVSAPTLVVTGEPALDRVVAVEGTREYVKLIPHAVGATLERTGHLGLVTRPAAFAEIVYDWSRQSAGPVG